MVGGCFDDLGSVRSCLGYKLKVVRRKKRDEYSNKDRFGVPKNVEVFSYESLQKATNNFTTRIGKGGFGCYYKGILEDGTTVFVKVLKGKNRGLDFLSLMKMMSRIRHRNVVECIGCCVEGDHEIIVQEFIGEHNLDQLLFDTYGKKVSLSWHMRASICLGIARGLEYLHHGISTRVVHRDIKPSNVLLDDKFNPKIADFDVSHLLDENLSHCSSQLVGTIGYIDPEYVMTGRFTEKADVYSFGILLLEVITGRKVFQFLRDNVDTTLVDWVCGSQKRDRIVEVADPTLDEFPEDELRRFINAALFCVQRSADLRPSMTEVLLMLSGCYDFSKKVLKKSDLLQRPNTSDKRSDGVSLMDVYDKDQEFMQDSNLFKRSLIDEVTETKEQMISRDNFEIESDLDTASDEAELMQTSHDLESELYSSIEPKIHAVTESGPRGQTSMVHDMASTSKPEFLVKRGALQTTENMAMPHDIFKLIELDTSVTATMPGPSLPGPSVEISADPETTTYSEAVEGLLLQAAGRNNEILSLPKVTTHRPIHSTVEKIVEALNDDETNIICLHGRAGSGKTAVLETLLHHPSLTPLFDQVICVTVPRLAHRQMIQNEIIQQLFLDVQNCKAEDEISALICRALTGRKVLLLLDDVWEVINLHDVGIPDPGPGNSCWLVLSTRSLDKCEVLTKKNIEMEVLSAAETWELFRYQVGDIVDSPEIESYARSIIEECHGLPLIVSALGSALKFENSVVEWELALKKLCPSNTTTEENQYPLSPQIKYCYDRLNSLDLKTCFLYCALFPRDKEIDVSLLVNFFMNEGLLGHRTVAAYRKGHDIVKHLAESSLLEASDECNVVKMHNVIRDSALAILSSSIEGYEILSRSSTSKLVETLNKHDTRPLSCHIDQYLTRAGFQFKEPPSLEEWEHATMIFLMDNGLSTLPSNPSCPNLVSLCLQRNKCLRVIPASFFDSMCSLRILNLSKTRIKSLPDSVSNLKNLEVLNLSDCERLLNIPSSIGLLENLEVLNLQGTELSHLPDSVGELRSLKQLQVSFYGSINDSKYTKLQPKLIPDRMISSLELRELGIFVHPGDERWILSASNVIKEVKNLKLSAFFFHFPEINHLELFLDKNQSWINGYLRMFNFIVGCDFKRIISKVSYDEEIMYGEEERCLRFVNGDNMPETVVEVIKRVTSFYLDHHLSIRRLSDFGIYTMNGLKRCILRDCPDLSCVVNVEKDTRYVLPFLEHLSLNHLWNLERIWTGHIEMGSLARLRYLSVHVCSKLRYVLTRSMIEVLINLEELVIEDCESLECIVIEDEKVIDDDETIRSTNITNFSGNQNTSLRLPVLTRLKMLKLHYLQKLCVIWKGSWPTLEYISVYDCPKLKNLHLDGNDALNIKEIAVEKAWWDTLHWDDSEVPRRLEERVSHICIDDL